MSKPPAYQIFRRSKPCAALVVQVRNPGTREAVNVLDLACYVAVDRIATPWHSVDIHKNSRLLLTDETAAPLLKGGSIIPLPPAPLIPWRDGDEAKQAARWEKTKSRRLAVQRPEARG